MKHYALKNDTEPSLYNIKFEFPRISDIRYEKLQYTIIRVRDSKFRITTTIVNFETIYW